MSNLTIYEIANSISSNKLLPTDSRYTTLKGDGYVKGDFPSTRELNGYLNNFSNNLKALEKLYNGMSNSFSAGEKVVHNHILIGSGNTIGFSSDLFRMKKKGTIWGTGNSINCSVPQSFQPLIFIDSQLPVYFDSASKKCGFYKISGSNPVINDKTTYYLFAIGTLVNDVLSNIKYIADISLDGLNAINTYEAVFGINENLYYRRIGNFQISKNLNVHSIYTFTAFNNDYRVSFSQRMFNFDMPLTTGTDHYHTILKGDFIVPDVAKNIIANIKIQAVYASSRSIYTEIIKSGDEILLNNFLEQVYETSSSRNFLINFNYSDLIYQLYLLSALTQFRVYVNTQTFVDPLE